MANAELLEWFAILAILEPQEREEAQQAAKNG